jgi:hypothetical protein
MHVEHAADGERRVAAVIQSHQQMLIAQLAQCRDDFDPRAHGEPGQ